MVRAISVALRTSCRFSSIISLRASRKVMPRLATAMTIDNPAINAKDRLIDRLANFLTTDIGNPEGRMTPSGLPMIF